MKHRLQRGESVSKKRATRSPCWAGTPNGRFASSPSGQADANAEPGDYYQRLQ
ncbi:MAG: hypothetical protein KDN22_31540 [Verrucomicrobiae bacterium]|nr:hypothetical protein [Verrucomicrobiae bacterium]